jgi:hypothetical protein
MRCALKGIASAGRNKRITKKTISPDMNPPWLFIKCDLEFAIGELCLMLAEYIISIFKIQSGNSYNTRIAAKTGLN